MKTYFRKGRRRIAVAAVVLAATGIVINCGKDSDDDSDIASTSAFSLVVPGSLAIASPTAAQTTTALRLLVEAPQDFKGREEAMAARLSCDDAATCARKFVAPTMPVNPSCYGPQIDYRYHPNGTDQSPYQLPSGDLGIWTSAESDGTACVAAKMNSQIESIAGYAQLALDMTTMVMGAANLSGASLPAAAGDFVDLKDAVVSKLTGQDIGATITAATLSRAADNGGRAAYDTTISVTPSGSLAGNVTGMSISVRHVAMDDTNATYKGKIWILITSTGSDAGQGISVLYSKTSETALKYEMRSRKARNSADASATSMFDSVKNVNYPGTNGAQGYNWAIVDLNPSTATGTVAYLWVAGSEMENTRSFFAKTEASGSSVNGTGYFGFGDELRNFTTANYETKWIDRMICNWAGPGNQKTGITKLQKQTMTMTGGKFVVGTNNITYTPSNDCSNNVGSGSSGTFGWKLPSGSSYTNFGSSNDLVSITGESIDIPTAPGEVM